MEYGNGTVVNYTYDTLDRIDQICYTDTNGNQKTYKYTYTTDGKIHTVEDSSSGVGYMYSYNSDGSMSGYIEYRLDSNENVIGIEYIYNEQSLIEQVNTSFTFATSSGTATDLILSYYEYNDDQSLKQLEIDTAGSNFNTYKIAYSYDKFNRLSSKTATYGSLTYETDYIYRNLDSTRASSQVSTYCTFINNIETSYSYTYDVNGNITSIVDDDDKVTQYKYDDQGQLIREDNPYFNKSYVYTYDNAGNRTSKKTYAYTTGTLGSVTSTDTYTYSDETWGDLLTGVNGSNITYDEIGNPSSNGAYHRYTWQNGRQLAQIFDTSHVYTYSYTYNADGIRTSKTVNGQKHTYTLNGSQIVSEEWTSGSTTHTLVYLYDESGSPIGLQYRPSSMVKEIFYTYFFEKNMQGDITAIFKENGVKIGYYSYDAWGNVKTTVYSNATALEKNIVQSYNPFRYRGYYYDTESGLYYLQSRYYNPQWGRFLNADGYINANGDIIGNNMYTYCSNNPVMNVDPTGESLREFLRNLRIVIPVISYVCTAVASIFNEDVREDMNRIGWNPFNSDEEEVLKSNYISFYKGEVVFRHSSENLSSWQISGTIFLNRDRTNATDVKHERGHGYQEAIIGPLGYMMYVAIPSMINCEFGDYKNYKDEREQDRIYYSKVWERTADWLGGVNRNNYNNFWDPINFRPW